MQLMGARKKRPVKDEKIFSLHGLILIAILLILGIGFVNIDRSRRIDIYFEKNIPQVSQIAHKNYRVGFVTDAHARFSKNSNSIIAESRIPMTYFVSKMNNDFKPAFVVDGGDFIEGSRRFGQQSINDFSEFQKIFENLKMPSYHVIGNHEIRGMSRETWLGLTQYEQTYYSFEVDNLKVIVLDSTLIPSSNKIGSDMDIAFEKQLTWLRNILENSSEFKKIIFIHHPPIATMNPTLSAARISDLNKIFSEFGVRAVFSGHVEIPYYAKIGGVDYFIVPGFFRSESKNTLFKQSFAEIKLGVRNKLKIYYTRESDTEYKTLTLPSEEYDAVKKEITKKGVDFFELTNN